MRPGTAGLLRARPALDKKSAEFLTTDQDRTLIVDWLQTLLEPVAHRVLVDLEEARQRLPPNSYGGFLQGGGWGGGTPSQRGCATVNAFRKRASASEVSRAVRDWSH